VFIAFLGSFIQRVSLGFTCSVQVAGFRGWDLGFRVGACGCARIWVLGQGRVSVGVVECVGLAYVLMCLF
jgi:hypothetical protein